MDRTQADKKVRKVWNHLPSSVSCMLDEVAKPRTFKKGEFLYHMGEEPKGLFFVHDGLIGLFNNTESGKEHLLRIFGKGQCLGHRSLAASEVYHGSAKVLETSNIGFIDAETSLKLLRSNSEFALQMLGKVARELRLAELRLAGNVDKQVAERVAEAMIYLKDSFPGHRWTRSEIAFYCGTTAPTVIRTLARFEESGYIKQEGREILILDKEALGKFANLSSS